MKHYFLLPLLLFFINLNYLSAQDELCNCPAQSKAGKGSFYFSWGYNKDWFSKSDIHFKNHSNEYNPVTGLQDNYDFTLYNLTAKDRPGFTTILTTPLTIPQYVFRLGYYFNNKRDLGIEINFDHAKYIVNDWQTVRLKGDIRGKEYDNDTLVDPQKFMHFQHTNGANFLMLNFVKRQNLLVSKNKKHWLSAVAKIGAGIVIPRTVVNLFGEGSNNFWHIAGYCTGIETGIRYDAFKHIFLEYTAKGTYANYTDVLTVRSGRANHHFYAFENILVLGIQFPL
jgi:hypothetical protein